MEDINIVDYSRQAEFDSEMAANLPKDESNIIIGCGGVGFWLGLMLAMNGYKDFVLIEGQKLDSTNLNRIPVPQSWIGINKAVALRKLIRQLRPDTRIVTLTSHITPETLGVIEKFAVNERLLRTTVWDTTDNALIQQHINKFVLNLKQKLISPSYNGRKVNYRKIGYEAWDIGCYENYDVWCDEDTYQAGYRTSRANASTSAMSACLGMFARGLNIKHDVSFNLKTLMQQTVVPVDDRVERLQATLRSVQNILQDLVDDVENSELCEDVSTTHANDVIDLLNQERSIL